jgi:hypothetical protein
MSEKVKSLDDEVAATQRLNAARHQGVAAMAGAEIENKLQPQIDKIKEMTETLRLMSATPGMDPRIVSAFSDALKAANVDLQKMKTDLKFLQDSDPSFWDKQREALDRYKESFLGLKMGFGGFADSLMKSKAQLSTEFFGALTQGFNGLNDSIAKFIVTGKGGFKAMLEQLLESLIKIGLQAAETAILMKLIPQAMQGAQTAGSAAAIAGDNAVRQAAIGAAAATAAIAAAIGGPAAAIAAAAATEVGLQGVTVTGALAGGGDVVPGGSYIVGEKRPELFVPDSAGHVYPRVGSGAAGGAGGAGGDVHINTSISAMDASGFDALLKKHASIVASHVRRQMRLAGAKA